MVLKEIGDNLLLCLLQGIIEDNVWLGYHDWSCPNHSCFMTLPLILSFE